MSEENNGQKFKYLSEDCIMPLNFYNYKQPFLGSCNGMRYRISLLTRELPLPADAKEGDKPPVEKLLLSDQVITAKDIPEALSILSSGEDGLSISESYTLLLTGEDALANVASFKGAEVKRGEYSYLASFSVPQNVENKGKDDPWTLYVFFCVERRFSEQ